MAERNVKKLGGEPLPARAWFGAWQCRRVSPAHGHKTRAGAPGAHFGGVVLYGVVWPEIVAPRASQAPPFDF